MKKPFRFANGLVVVGVLASLVMAVGPGVFLANRPDTYRGLPRVYAWAVLWYGVIVTIALAANFFVWRHEEASDGDEP